MPTFRFQRLVFVLSIIGGAIALLSVSYGWMAFRPTDFGRVEELAREAEVLRERRLARLAEAVGVGAKAAQPLGELARDRRYLLTSDDEPALEDGRRNLYFLWNFQALSLGGDDLTTTSGRVSLRERLRESRWMWSNINETEPSSLTLSMERVASYRRALERPLPADPDLEKLHTIEAMQWSLPALEAGLRGDDAAARRLIVNAIGFGLLQREQSWSSSRLGFEDFWRLPALAPSISGVDDATLARLDALLKSAYISPTEEKAFTAEQAHRGFADFRKSLGDVAPIEPPTHWSRPALNIWRAMLSPMILNNARRLAVTRAAGDEETYEALAEENARMADLMRLRRYLLGPFERLGDPKSFNRDIDIARLMLAIGRHERAHGVLPETEDQIRIYLGDDFPQGDWTFQVDRLSRFSVNLWNGNTADPRSDEGEKTEHGRALKGFDREMQSILRRTNHPDPDEFEFIVEQRPYYYFVLEPRSRRPRYHQYNHEDWALILMPLKPPNWAPVLKAMEAQAGAAYKAASATSDGRRQ